MFGPINIITMQAWNVLESSPTREERTWAIAELSTAYNAHDHVKHRVGYFFVRAQNREYVVLRDDGTGETEYNAYPETFDGLNTAIFNATIRAMREISQ